MTSPLIKKKKNFLAIYALGEIHIHNFRRANTHFEMAGHHSKCCNRSAQLAGANSFVPKRHSFVTKSRIARRNIKNGLIGRFLIGILLIGIFLIGIFLIEIPY